MGPEVIVGAIAAVIVLTSSVTGGAVWLQNESQKKVDKVREEADGRIDGLLNTSKSQVELVLSHVQSMERVLGEMRADLPKTYTLKEDHLRLSDKVEKLTIEFWRRDSTNDSH
jgi:hypothetical protein